LPDDLIFREACLEDARLLLEWRNDESTRSFSISNQKIDYPSHTIWLKNTLANENITFKILEKNKIPVGTIRAEKINEASYLSWTISPKFRKQGLGKYLVLQFANKIEGKLFAKIKKENVASISIAKSAGFKLLKKSNNLLLFVRD